MKKYAGTLIGKSVRLATSFRPNGGQALPGLVVQSIFPSYVQRMLSQLPDGVIMITGTNGKTTTTKILVHLLKASGKKVITNSTGSNLVRGIASSLISHSNLSSKLNFDIAVFEVDEASARRLVAEVKPRWLLALNVSRDQLDRFGEVDIIAQHIGNAMEAATEGVVANADDPHLLQLSSNLEPAIKTRYFGVSPKLAAFFPSDSQLAAVEESKPANKKQRPELGVELTEFSGQKASYKINGKLYTANLKLTGQHNYQNAAAALALAKQLLPSVADDDLVNQLSQVSIAFGRGETYKLKNGADVELVLVKNPASFRQALASYANSTPNLMIAINDNIADGRDVSWLWDVDFQSLGKDKYIVASGKRAADMALRLSYDQVKVSHIEPNLIKALDGLAKATGHKVILSTYTAMLSLYEHLNKTAAKKL